MFMQNVIKLSAAVHEIVLRERNKKLRNYANKLPDCRKSL